MIYCNQDKGREANNMRIENEEVIMSAEELNIILEFAVLNGCENCEFYPQCFFAADCITNDFKYYLEKK